MRRNLIKKKPKCKSSLDGLVDVITANDSVDPRNASKIIEDFCTKDSCAADLTQVAQSWRDWCVSPDGTALVVESYKANDASMGSIELLGYIFMMGCTKQTSGTDAGYCAGKLFNMSAVFFKSNVTDDDVKAGACPAYASCCFSEFKKTSNAWGDDETKGVDQDCPGALKAAKLTTCA